MQVLIAVIDDATGSATDAEMAAIGAFNRRLVDEGRRILACGLAAPADAVVIDARGDEQREAPSITSGPLHDTRDYMSGLWIIEADDLEHARALAIEASHACNRRVEVRELLGR